MKKGISDKVIKRIESIEGCSIGQALTQLYFEQFFTFRKLMQRWKCQPKQLIKIFSYCNLTPRKGGDAVKTQWINNAERRKQASEIFKKYIAATPDFKQRGIENLTKFRASNPHPLLGRKRQDSRERMTKNNPMFRDEIKNKAKRKTDAYYNINPKLRSQYHKEPTKCEAILGDFLKSSGLEIIYNESIDRYFPDITIPSLHIAIECIGSRYPLSLERHKIIESKNYKIIYCQNSFIKKGRFDRLYEYIITGKIFGSNPTSKGKETVVWGRAYGTVFGADDKNFTVISIHMDGYNVSFLTATTNDSLVGF